MKKYRAVIGGRKYSLELEEVDGPEPGEEVDLDSGLDLEGQGDGIIRAPMAGSIWSLELGPGARVSQGQVLMILEAMKMENQIRAPRAGQVKEVLVGPGDLVEKGQKLIILV